MRSALRQRALPFAACLGWLACHGALTHIDLSRSASTDVPQGTVLSDLLGTIGFSSFASMNLTASEELQNQGVEPGDITEVHFTELELVATSGAPDLSFIHSMTISVEAEGLPTVVVASQSDFPPGEAAVQFELEEVDLADYVVSESMTIITDVDGEAPSEDTTVEGRFTLDVGVTAQGACHATKKH